MPAANRALNGAGAGTHKTRLADVRILSDAALWPEVVDLLIDGGTVVEVLRGEARRHPTAAEVTIRDMAGALVMAGHVNAHAHNNELYEKATSGGLPLELYMLSTSRVRGHRRLSDAELYDSTLVCAHEMIRNGITAVADDVHHARLDYDAVSAVLRAYDDSGMRARVSIETQNSPWRRSMLLDGVGDAEDPILDDIPQDSAVVLALYRRLLEEWADSTRVGLMVSPSAPQRCSPGLLHDLFALAEEFDVPFHLHIQESVTQWRHGPLLLDGRSMIRFMADEGLLSARTMIAHAIWLDEEDIATIAASGATVVHNPVSNAKLGSGIAPVRKLLTAGVPVALGTDGLSCNDAIDLFEVSKMAALFSNLVSTHWQDWLSPREVFTAASAGADVMRLGSPTGVEPGAAADLVFLDADSFAFLPRNDAVAQTIFSAGRRDVRDVMVDGRFLVVDAVILDDRFAAAKRRVVESARLFWESAEHVPAEHLMEPIRRARDGAIAEARDGGGPYRLVPPFPPN